MLYTQTLTSHTNTHTHTHKHTHTHTHTRTLKFQCYLQEELVVLVRMTVKFVATHMTKCKAYGTHRSVTCLEAALHQIQKQT